MANIVLPFVIPPGIRPIYGTFYKMKTVLHHRKSILLDGNIKTGILPACIRNISAVLLSVDPGLRVVWRLAVNEK